MIFLKIEIKSYKNLINLLFIFININFVFLMVMKILNLFFYLSKIDN